MKKEEIQQLTKVLIPAVKRMIKAEIKRVAKPLIEEAVENKVNKILAEHFLNNVGKQSLTETFIEKPKRKERDYSHDREQQRQKLGQNLLEKIGANEDPMLMEIYEDVDLESVGGPSAPAAQIGGHPVYVDPDDDGVDLSRFGL